MSALCKKNHRGCNSCTILFSEMPHRWGF